MKFSQLRLHAAKTTLWEVLRLPIVRNAALWIFILLLILSVVNLFEGGDHLRPKAVPPEEQKRLISILISWLPVILLVGVWILFVARFGTLTRRWFILNSALWLIIALSLFGMFNLFAAPQ